MTFEVAMATAELCVGLYSTANDPPTRNDPQIGPKMIPEVDRKWSHWKTRKGMEFVPRVEISIFNLNGNKSWLTIFYVHIILMLIDYRKSSAECLVIGFANM